ncbi:hypothetical protein PR202_gb25160 [Eleusine coracana subsp. coracana]|uniref:Pectin acetylesterase n=1 Tax=Eleusine coracana subsp. coracana TaxID=191504 RepID=A0AAV5FNV3_ELECO|nr:hypothetical protein PR202_gb25160 [Eleusine coracana subsp. coracana]
MPPPPSAPAFHHLRLWWRRRGRAGAVGATFSVAFLAAALLLTLSYYASTPPANSSTSSSGRSPALVGLTLVRGAEEKGALCLDGSAPGYHLQRGSGGGSRSWLIHLEGGGWCRNLRSCASRQKSMLGSSHYMERQIEFAGILSDDESQNPDFFNWNKVKTRYCDGASFSGNVKDELKNGTRFFFRGQLILEAVMNELLLKGLGQAKQDLRQRFLDCNSNLEPGQCFFPREVVKNIVTPVFVLNSAYDAWQVQHVLAPQSSDPQHSWLDCRLDISKCSPNQLEILQGFRKEMLDAISELQQKSDWGMYINSCFVHCQSLNSFTWHSPSSPRVNNKN